MARRSTPDLLTIASAVYARLRADVLAGTLAPGQKLRIEGLCRRYAAGNSPVREALNRLSSEGLIERREQRGFYVVDTSAEDLAELVRTRCWLESIALRESMARATEPWHERLVLALHRMSRTPRSTSPDAYEENPEWEAVHRSFHRTLISQCASARLVRYCEDLADQAYRYRQLSMQRAYLTRDVKGEHEALVRAVLDGAAAGAVELLVRHYRRTAELVGDADAFAQDAAPLATPAR